QDKMYAKVAICTRKTMIPLRENHAFLIKTQERNKYIMIRYTVRDGTYHTNTIEWHCIPNGWIATEFTPINMVISNFDKNEQTNNKYFVEYRAVKNKLNDLFDDQTLRWLKKEWSRISFTQWLVLKFEVFVESVKRFADNCKSMFKRALEKVHVEFLFKM
ncbi:3611_t:CDS:2, partial [Racocetra persica]